MNQYLIFILGAVAGGILVWFVMKMPEKKKKESLIEKQAREKEKNLNKILERFGTHEKVSNDEIENLLNVSDATATRYLEELEKEGKVKQVGNTGTGVYYERLNDISR